MFLEVSAEGSLPGSLFVLSDVSGVSFPADVSGALLSAEVSGVSLPVEAVRSSPHSEQNSDPGVFSCPFEQRRTEVSFSPQSGQYTIVLSHSAPHFWHFVLFRLEQEKTHNSRAKANNTATKSFAFIITKSFRIASISR